MARPTRLPATLREHLDCGHPDSPRELRFDQRAADVENVVHAARRTARGHLLRCDPRPTPPARLLSGRCAVDCARCRDTRSRRSDIEPRYLDDAVGDA